MRTKNHQIKDEVLEAAKRESQERSREQVRSGVRSQQSMYFISPEIARELKIEHRWLSGD